MASKNCIYLKVKTKIVFTHDSLDYRIAGLLDKHGLCFESFKAFVEKHRHETSLLSYGVYNRVTGVTSIVRPVQPMEYVYEIDFTNRLVRAYVSGFRAYKVFKFPEVMEMKRAA